jgi:hypothetical protein
MFRSTWIEWILRIGVAACFIGHGAFGIITKAVIAWMAVWAVWTALLRPLAGQSVSEFIERAGNFGVPLALLYLSGWGRSGLTWLRTKASPRQLQQFETARLPGRVLSASAEVRAA